MNPYETPYTNIVANQSQDVRANFIKNTYIHLAMAVVGFIAIEYCLIKFTNLGEVMLSFLSINSFMWLAVLGGFMGVAFVAQNMASSASKGTQYGGMALYVVGESIIFLPLLYMAAAFSPGAIEQAGIATGGLFLALTVVAFTTKKDFSFLGGMLKVGFIVALALIAASIFFGFNLGLIFSAAMIVLASGSILYNTSNIIHKYHHSQYVAASIGLFASVALLFWYILRIFMSRD